MLDWEDAREGDIMNGVLRCEKCGSDESVVVVKKETIPVRGEDIVIESNVRICECGNELFDEALEEENLTLAYNEYRKQHNLLGPQEIREIREKYGLSQRTLGKILGWGEITIHRYETGAIPDTSHHKMLKLLKDPEVMKTLLIEAQDLIPKTTFKRTMERISSILEEKEIDKFQSMVQNKLQHKSMDIESGFKQFDFQKFAQVVLFFAQKIDQLWKTKLNKLLFYADFLNFRESTVSLTGARYLKFNHGPVPQDYEMLFWSLKESGLINIRVAQAIDYSGELIQPLAEFDPDVFTKKELDVLEQVVQKYGNFNSRKIREVSHEEKGWIETNFSDAIPYHFALELND